MKGISYQNHLSKGKGNIDQRSFSLHPSLLVSFEYPFEVLTKVKWFLMKL